MAFKFNFKKDSEPVVPNSSSENSKYEEGELTAEELENVTAYNSYPYGFSQDLSNNLNIESVIPQRGRR